MSEHQHKEWKASWRGEYLKWACGFANAEGGVLVTGRDDACIDTRKHAVKSASKTPGWVRATLAEVATHIVKAHPGQPDGHEPPLCDHGGSWVEAAWAWRARPRQA